MSDTQHKSINRTKIDRRIDKHFMQSYWSALQFPPTNLPVLYRGMPQASHGINWLLVISGLGDISSCIACSAGVFSKSHAQYVLHWMSSRHLEFLKQSKIAEGNKLPPSGWVRSRTDEVRKCHGLWLGLHLTQRHD